MTIWRSAGAIALAIASLSGCDRFEEAPKARVAEPLPAAICDKAKEAVRQITDTGVLMMTSPTEGAIAQEHWLPMSRPQKDALLTAIGLAATCAGEPALEQEVTLRSETGDVLARQVVTTSYSVGDALEM
jgi:hypothetical protein